MIHDMGNIMTNAELMNALKTFSVKAVSDAAGPLEPLERATYYVANRIAEGHIRDIQEMKGVWAAFADGFCTARGHKS